MVISNKWGQGQLFAFSALDGKSYFSDDFAGILSGDRLGIRFFSKTKRELAIVNFKPASFTYDAVVSDYICCTYGGEKIKIIYSDTHLIIGKVCGGVIPVVFCEGACEVNKSGKIEIHDTYDGEYTALLQDDQKFVFAYGKSIDEVLSLVNKGMETDIEEAESKKLKFYSEHSLNCGEYSKLYTKCLSVMKTQLYTPEGGFKTVWSTPDRLPHKRLFLWDSVFHAIGHRHISPEVARNLISAIFANQENDGFIPHAAAPDMKSNLTQPPVIAWGGLKVYEAEPDKVFLQEVYEKNSKFLRWCHDNRRMSDEYLYIWKTEGIVECRCGESGMDNSSRFDKVINAQAIDFSCFMANEMRCMSKIARIIGKDDDADAYDIWFEKIKTCINEKLWDIEDEFYYDYDFDNKNLSKVKTTASFLPLFSGICSTEKASALVEYLNNPSEFDTEVPVPTVAVNDEMFGTDMWRGPVWINYNYMIEEGLRNYGYNVEADKIVSKTIACMNKWYDKFGVIFEFYDCEDKKAPKELYRKGEPIEPYNFELRTQTVRDFGWSSALLCDMLADYYAENKKDEL